MGYSVFKSMFEPKIEINYKLEKFINLGKLEELIFESNL